jgi:hypothetical protein
MERRTKIQSFVHEKSNDAISPFWVDYVFVKPKGIRRNNWTKYEVTSLLKRASIASVYFRRVNLKAA